MPGESGPEGTFCHSGKKQLRLQKAMANPLLHQNDQPITPEDQVIDKTLRPKLLDEFSGQEKLVENLRIFIEAAKMLR